MNQRQKHTLMAAVVALLGIVLILIVVWIFSRQYRFTEYHNDKHGFSIGYPATWEILENPDGEGGAAVVFIAPQENDLDTFRESVNIVIDDRTNKPIKLKAYSEIAIAQMELVFEDNFVLLKSEMIRISGEPGYRIIFLGKGGPDFEMKYMSAWMIKDDIAYQITYTTFSSQYDHYVLDMKRMLRSFRLD